MEEQRRFSVFCVVEVMTIRTLFIELFIAIVIYISLPLLHIIAINAIIAIVVLVEQNAI